ncbi:periplasmic binding family protein [Hephaestia caeni]|uniref:Periplasmic binding family protein n=1 Tax=Hephaestia caeni TaxID=645617 RepID=A0A397PJJ2_9SPHN|nr:substrate-binding domain-containing protein [Hephaestia caeni]RIA46324.1 periplasmic binding family protein [Hephaestia caeni]
MKRFHSALFLASVASMALASAASAQSIPTPGPNDGFNRLNGAGATAVQEIVWDERDAIVISDPNFQAEYLPTGSGAGRQSWRNVTPQGPVPWNTVQYAFSESPTSASEITQYNANVGAYGLRPIQVPKFVLPVAIAYNPHYATVGGTQLRFQVNSTFPASTTQINGVNVGGLRLPRAVYCNIFNGTLTNWNAAALQTANGGVSLGDPLDTNWSTFGAPIRLVGRMDRSGTTDIFTRAMAAHCGGKYIQAAEALPYNRGGAVPIYTTERADTPYASSSTAPLAGTTNMIGTQYFNGTTIATTAIPNGGPQSNPAPGSHNGSGFFLMADGSGRVAGAIAAAPDFPSGGRTYNGKIGYIGADFIRNAVSGNTNLYAAALNRPAAPTVWNLPSSAAASAAFGTVAAPESDVSTGAFANFGTDPRGASRADPLSWVNVLSGLTSSTAGYPITGASQMLLHTCYKPNNLPSIRTWLSYNVGIPDDRFTNPTTGLMAQSNIGALPASWQRAVNQTFLTNSTEVSNGQTLGALNLWMAAGGTAGHCSGVSTLPGSTQPGM